MKDHRGFTLVELLTVIAIISILAMVAVPAYVGQQKKAARTEAVKNLEALRLLEEQFFSENAQYTASAADAAAIQALLPGFQPGQDMKYSYQIVQNVAVDTPITSPPTWGTAQNPCFTAIATGDPGTRVAGDVFVIDCNYNKSF